jgi:hypothetical protein
VVPIEVREDHEVDVIRGKTSMGKKLIERFEIDYIVELLSGVTEFVALRSLDVLSIFGSRAADVDEDVQTALVRLDQPRNIRQVDFLPEVVQEGEATFLAPRTVRSDQWRD